jgi:hypothetical protein
MREVINAIFDALDLLVVRATLLTLLILGASTLIRCHKQSKDPADPPI